jgi:hypothetical protein
MPGQKTNVDNTTCDSCDLGMFGKKENLVLDCYDCQIGQFQDDKGQTKCKDCREDRYGIE